MTSYSGKTYTYDGLNVQYGLPLAFNLLGKYPAITKRIFDTVAEAQAFINNDKDTAIPGLILTVVTDEETKNGLYFVKSVGDGENDGEMVQIPLNAGSSIEIADGDSGLTWTDDEKLSSQPVIDIIKDNEKVIAQAFSILRSSLGLSDRLAYIGLVPDVSSMSDAVDTLYTQLQSIMNNKVIDCGSWD